MSKRLHNFEKGDQSKKNKEIVFTSTELLKKFTIGDKSAYFETLRLLLAFVFPTLIPVYFWNETWYWAIMTQVFMRYAYSLNCTWGVNSFAHMFGNHPYDRTIAPAENFMMTLMTGGEGWHNYHHTFPWDYKTSELGNYLTSVNLTSFLIEMFAKIGWAYDLKHPSKELIESVVKNRGDGTHKLNKIEKTF